MRHISIKTRLSVGLSALLLLSFLAVSLINYYVAKTSIRRGLIQDALPIISNNIYSDLQNDLITPINVSSLMAHDTFLKDWVLAGEQGLDNIVKYLKEIKVRYGFFTAFFVSERSKRYYFYDGVLKEISRQNDHDQWYWNFKELDAAYDLDVDTNQAAAGALTIFINHRLTGYGGEFLGVTGVGLNMNKVGELLLSYQKRYGKRVYLVDGQGLVQVHADTARVMKVNIHEEEGLGQVAQQLLAAREHAVNAEFDRRGQHVILMSRFIPEFGWHLMVEQVESHLLGEIKTSFYRSLGIGLVVTFLVIVVIVFMVNFYQGRLEQLATTDGLTGCLNRRQFRELAQRELAQAQRGGSPASLIMLDADHFKLFNDRHGHLAGDQALKSLVGAAQDQLREYDILGRWGGEEFAALLPRTSRAQALKVAERIRSAVEALSMEAASRGGITISAGVAQSREIGESLDELLARADAALYRAKDLGRNRVEPETDGTGGAGGGRGGEA